MKQPRALVAAVGLGMLLVASPVVTSRAFGQVAYPMVMSVAPLAVQIGSSGECEISARYNLYGAYQVFVTGEGVVAEVIPPEPPATPPTPPAKPEVPKLKVRFTVAATALPGVREVRVATPQGASTVANLVLVADPVIRETPDNSTQAMAQVVTLPATLCGAFEQNEDVDYYRFALAAPSAWTFHVQSARCQDQIHDLQAHADPIVTLRNAGGTVLASNDNYYFADPLLHYAFPAAGDYLLEVRDVRYTGNVDWQYSIEVTDRPFVTNVLPLGVPPGATTPLTLVGYNLPADATVLFTLPPEQAEGPGRWPLVFNGQATNGVPLVVTRFPEMREQNAENGQPATAQPLGVPAGLSGRIETPADVDCYAFEAPAGEHLTFEVLARRNGSSLDPYLRILNDQGQVVSESDDMTWGRHTYSDVLLENWAAPAAGRYTLELRDLHQRGGPEYVYLLKLSRSRPYFTLDTDTDKTLLAPGTTSVLYARVYRRNGYEGEIQLSVEGLPPGVTAQPGRILAAGTDGAILLTAAADAPSGAANIRVIGTAAARDAQPACKAVAAPLQELYMPGGGRFHYPVSTHTVSVGDPLDLVSVTLSQYEVTLAPGSSQKIDVTIARRPGFTGNITLDVVYQHLGSIFGNSLPPGVTLDDKASLTVVSGEAVQGHLTLVAAADAKPVERQLVPVMAHVSLNFVMKMTYCAQPLWVTVK